MKKRKWLAWWIINNLALPVSSCFHRPCSKRERTESWTSPRESAGNTSQQVRNSCYVDMHSALLWLCVCSTKLVHAPLKFRFTYWYLYTSTGKPVDEPSHTDYVPNIKQTQTVTERRLSWTKLTLFVLNCLDRQCVRSKLGGKSKFANLLLT